ncbi:hypothetical protein DTO027B5_7573 [Paecilomyces variotii]|nr:hypothetical protein DTO169E5_106 [Paecilomyces variotii]KAJ9248078.1 hypothetical protein DTO207G8_7624 [Paecilomyces variotii]KAJ9327719.1 hypothetical protein DTO027B3_1427 [Paecilomyces variotii]KAJ9330669.1 hypothetical protein DTO027B5_7573 [Paecilomyces variotii]
MPHYNESSTPAETIADIDQKVTDADPSDVDNNIPTVNDDSSPGSLPYWLVNVPRSEWPAECPEYLRDLVPKSIKCLSTPDEAYKRQDWELVKEIVGTNHIERFQRVPSDLRRYLEYTAQIKKKYGSVMDFIVKKRLHWGEGRPQDLKPKGRPFECDEDIKILYNDWPYGVETDIIHLVVWVKFDLEDDPATDDLTPKARQEIEEYVQRTFCSRIPREEIVWFKNWKSLKSVHAIEHFHVMIHNPDMDFVRELTHGDMPLIERVKNGESGF